MCTSSRCACPSDGPTLGITEEGLVRINAIDAETMQVLSRDPETGEIAFRDILNHSSVSTPFGSSLRCLSLRSTAKNDAGYFDETSKRSA